MELQSKLDSLKVEEERLERMLEYMRTTDYMIQYAREKLGYVFHDDFKFFDDAAQAKATPKFADTPTPAPALTTPTPRPTPVPTPLPTLAPGTVIVT
ncbi:MAG: hypothetical protein C0413_02390, partial [Clostridiales bacterium]|nr:hypothetical protein [Clostridiales bacterium]